MSQLFASGGQSIEPLASASVFSMSIQDWFPLGLTGSISLLSKGLWRVFSGTTVEKHPCGIYDIKKRSLSALSVTWRRKRNSLGLISWELCWYTDKDSLHGQSLARLFWVPLTQRNMCVLRMMSRKGWSHTLMSFSMCHQSSESLMVPWEGEGVTRMLLWDETPGGSSECLPTRTPPGPTETWTKTNIISNSSRLHPLGTLGPSKCPPQKLKAARRTDNGFQRPLRTGSQLLASVRREKSDRRQSDGAGWCHMDQHFISLTLLSPHHLLPTLSFSL